MNDLAVSHVLSGPGALGGPLPGDPDANPANFYASEQRGVGPLPPSRSLSAPRIQLTRNIHKEMDYVNGMGATILGLQQGRCASEGTGHWLSLLWSTPWTDAESQSTYHPLRLGYANTLD